MRCSSAVRFFDLDDRPSDVVYDGCKGTHHRIVSANDATTTLAEECVDARGVELLGALYA